eukprot:TRINITY_DN31924_c0_g1_i1.p1 TRINITY_DN31924_c0_g1~~TRINITY_DN31924_c0_g1_i1.p1  ORF type:complete len:740 (-),score=162.22 TRINITY_DN31924_c0_g1_i1:536-2755(-)
MHPWQKRSGTLDATAAGAAAEAASGGAPASARARRSATAAAALPAAAAGAADAEAKATNGAGAEAAVQGSALEARDAPLVFQALGYGAALLRRLLQEMGWKAVEDCEEDAAVLPKLLWSGSVSGRRLFRTVSHRTQLVNHFPGGGAMGSKSATVHNLRLFCLKGRKLDLSSFFPRAYDLRCPLELMAFIIDFAVTRAEAILRTESPRNGPIDGDMRKVFDALALLENRFDLLERLSLLVEAESDPVAEPDRLAALSAGELDLVCGGSANAANAVAEQRTAGGARLDDDSLAASLAIETRWWLRKLQEDPRRQFALNGQRALWFLKQPSLNCGRGVQVFQELPALLDAAKRGGWDFVVQKYMERPLLVGSPARKCDLRVWVLVTSWNPAVVWAWPEPYLRLASKPFHWDHAGGEDQQLVHLTNRTVQKQVDSPGEGGEGQPRKEDEEHIWLLPTFLDWLDANRPDLKGRSVWTASTWPRILEVVRACVLASQSDVGANTRGCFELFGFDFLLDEDMQPWFLEANSSPDLCEDGGPSLRRLTEGALKELLALVFALNSGAVTLPPPGSASEAASCDRATPGSGRWRLCLQEARARTEYELRADRSAKSVRRALMKPGPEAKRLGIDHQARIIRSLLGDIAVPASASAAARGGGDHSPKKANAASAPLTAGLLRSASPAGKTPPQQQLELFKVRGRASWSVPRASSSSATAREAFRASSIMKPHLRRLSLGAARAARKRQVF